MDSNLRFPNRSVLFLRQPTGLASRFDSRLTGEQQGFEPPVPPQKKTFFEVTLPIFLPQEKSGFRHSDATQGAASRCERNCLTVVGRSSRGRPVAQVRLCRRGETGGSNLQAEGLIGPAGGSRRRPPPPILPSRGIGVPHPSLHAATAAAGDPVKGGRLVRSGDEHDPTQGFQFVSDHQADYPIASTSSTHSSHWRRHPAADTSCVGVPAPQARCRANDFA